MTPNSYSKKAGEPRWSLSFRALKPWPLCSRTCRAGLADGEQGEAPQSLEPWHRKSGSQAGHPLQSRIFLTWTQILSIWQHFFSISFSSWTLCTSSKPRKKGQFDSYQNMRRHIFIHVKVVANSPAAFSPYETLHVSSNWEITSFLFEMKTLIWGMAQMFSVAGENVLVGWEQQQDEFPLMGTRKKEN